MMSVPDRWCDRRDRLPLALLLIFFAIVAIAGGSARADVLGQAVVRGASVALMIALVATGTRIDAKTYRPLFIILAACVTLIVVELVPLPPALWSSLPGRAMFVAATRDAGLPTPWRPIAIYPDGAVNALFSLLVPLAALMGIAALGPRGVKQLLPAMVVWVAVSAFITLLQASGGWFSNPFINDEARQYAGLFANRNHNALFLAIGTVAAAYWGFARGRRDLRRVLLAAGLIVLFVLTNLVTGSRTGLIVEFVALIAGVSMAIIGTNRRGDGSGTRRLLILLVILAVGALLLWLSLSYNRAASLDRLLGQSAEDDTRFLAAPTVWILVMHFAPVGSGAGSFDQAFRIAEPLWFLDTTYMNHAHNDWLELPLEYGLAGIFVVLCGLAWLIWRGGRAWLRSSRGLMLARCGSLCIALVAAAALTDYAARTPIMMVALIIAASWLCASRLPGWEEHVALRRNARSL